MSRPRRLAHRIRRQLAKRGANVSDVRADPVYGAYVIYVWDPEGVRPYVGHVAAGRGGGLCALRFDSEGHPTAKLFRAPLAATQYVLGGEG